MGIKQMTKPPPQMMPISWMPLNWVNPMARKAPAVVMAPVTMPCR